MAITIVSASSEIRALMEAPPGQNIRGLQPQDVKKIRRQITALQDASSMIELMKAHPEWRIHRYKGDEQIWSFDVGGATRLLMDWDNDRKEVSNLRFDNPH